MFAGFNLKTKIFTDVALKGGRLILEENEKNVRDRIKQISTEEKILDGSIIQEDWFPQIRANVFISHSRSDENIAICLVYHLKQKLGLTSFIDSSVWGYANDLLKIIDKENSWDPERQLYDYDTRNYTTSHVHMMLATALNMMIDKTECLIFLNTPNSISTKKVINETTSPWIYHEISFSRTIQRNIPERHQQLITESRIFNKGLEETQLPFKVKYTLDLNHLTSLTDDDLLRWTMSKSKGVGALDDLYKSKGILTSQNFI